MRLTTMPSRCFRTDKESLDHCHQDFSGRSWRHCFPPRLSFSSTSIQTSPCSRSQHLLGQCFVRTFVCTVVCTMVWTECALYMFCVLADIVVSVQLPLAISGRPKGSTFQHGEWPACFQAEGKVPKSRATKVSLYSTS